MNAQTELNGYERRKLATGQAILDAAKELVRKTGGTDFSMLNLATRAGVSPATPFNHFGSKKRILGAIIDQSLLIQPIPNLEGPNYIRQVVAAVVNMTRLYSRDPRLYRPVFGATIADISRSNPALQTALKRIFGLLRQARDNGELNKHVDLETLAEQLESYWLGSLLFWINGSVSGPTWITRVESGLSLMLEGAVAKGRS